VHAAFSGCPIVGDEKYIKKDEIPLCGMAKVRLMLHAKEIHFKLPNGEKVSFEAPYDEVFKSNLI